MVVIIWGKYGNTQWRTENVTERTRFSKSRSNDLEDIGHGRGQGRKISKICQKFKFSDFEEKLNTQHKPLMIVIICAKYKRNPSRTVDATERTRFSKSRSNYLEDIGQGQRSSHATHLLMLVIICTKYGKNPSWTVDATGRTQKVNRQTDGQTDRQTDRQGESNIPPLTSLRGV